MAVAAAIQGSEAKEMAIFQEPSLIHHQLHFLHLRPAVVVGNRGIRLTWMKGCCCFRLAQAEWQRHTMAALAAKNAQEGLASCSASRIERASENANAKPVADEHRLMVRTEVAMAAALAGIDEKGTSAALTAGSGVAPKRRMIGSLNFV